MSAIFFTADRHVSVFTVSRAYTTGFTATIDQASLIKAASSVSTYICNAEQCFKYSIKHHPFSLAAAVYFMLVLLHLNTFAAFIK